MNVTHDTSSRLASAMETRYERYLHDLRLLTSIDCPTRYKVGLDQVATIIGGLLAEAGAEVTIHKNDEAGNDVVGTLRGAGRKRIVLLCHTDTVYPVGVCEARPFRIEGSHALAPGVCDEKGGLLAAIYSLMLLRDIGFEDFGELEVFCNSDEENAPRHSVEMIKETARTADAVLTMEPARINGDIVSARKGVLVQVVTAVGREAHAGVNPDIGRSAIVGLADRVVELWKLNGALPGLNVNPGLIRGGSSVNTIAGEARVELDVRVANRADIDRFDDMLAETIAASIVPDVTFSTSREHTMPPMEKTPASERLVRLAQQAAQELDFELHDTATGGGSDGAYASEVGAPVLDGLGPIGGFAHSQNEFLDLESVVPRTALLARLITLI